MLFLGVITSSLCLAKDFNDLSNNHWAYQYINELSNKNIINGYNDGTFKPNATITNAEFIKLLVMLGVPDDISLSDYGSNINHWAGSYVEIARYDGILKQSFSPDTLNEDITRIEMVEMLSRADKALGNELIVGQELPFSDLDTLTNDDQFDLLSHAVANKLINGYEDGTFRPNNHMTRAEASTVIYRFLNRNVGKNYQLPIKEEKKIDFFALKSHSGFNDALYNDMFIITSQEALDVFCTLYKGFKISNHYDLSQNTMFVETLAFGSGSIRVNFNEVRINKNVEFIVKVDYPEMGTADMAYWYLVAIVPNEKLKGVNVDTWKSPIDAKNSMKTEYNITVNSSSLGLETFLSIVEKEVKGVDNTIITDCSYSYNRDTNNTSIDFHLLSCDKDSSEKLVQNINKQGNEMDAFISSTNTISDEIFKYHQEAWKNNKMKRYVINISSRLSDDFKWRNSNKR